ncbi:MAG: hypothetical protein M3417_14890 [Actinomycetota bacterium]|nr:hypothetical protein [Actinomycetota bacterium]
MINGLAATLIARIPAAMLPTAGSHGHHPSSTCHTHAMCVQCMMGAMGATAGASGTRAWLATRQWVWLTPPVLRKITVGLLAVVLIASTILIGGSTPSGQADPRAQSHGSSAAATADALHRR